MNGFDARCCRSLLSFVVAARCSRSSLPLAAAPLSLPLAALVCRCRSLLPQKTLAALFRKKECCLLKFLLSVDYSGGPGFSLEGCFSGGPGFSP